MEKVYLKKIDSYSKTSEISAAAAELLEKVEEESGIKFRGKVPIKVHFGEEGNITFIGAENFGGIAEHLKKSGARPFFTDTNVLYKSERTTEESHIALAKKHGFGYLPIKIADGKMGEAFEEVEINKNHFKKCKIGKVIADTKQMVVLAHFKGHMETGFGGALKQLGMGCAARTGKLEMHANSKPTLNPLKCKKCKTCTKSCPTDAIIIGLVPRIDYKKCTGCAACIAVCPNRAMGVNWLSITPSKFMEKMAEYAYAAQRGKEAAYINFIFNVTDNCDCIKHKMKPVYSDLGVLASKDPVALDGACLDLLAKKEGRKFLFGGHIFDYAEKIGLGKKEYEIIEI
ncbi:MAG: DUF362 domain-containing protein [Candidatus Diapherotrites archaeon]|nr:DUF362 domain-containing protein [Candidatus Diapherotrites archaeon]